MQGCNCRRCRGAGKNVGWIIGIIILTLGWTLAQFGRTYLPATIDSLAIGSVLVVIGFVWTVVVAAMRAKWWVIGIALIMFGIIFPSIISYIFRVNTMIGTIFPSAEGVLLGFVATGIIIIGVLFLVAYGIRAFLRFLSH